MCPFRFGFFYSFQSVELDTYADGRWPKTRGVHAPAGHARVGLLPGRRGQNPHVHSRPLPGPRIRSHQAHAGRRLANVTVGSFGQIPVRDAAPFLPVRLGESAAVVCITWRRSPCSYRSRIDHREQTLFYYSRRSFWNVYTRRWRFFTVQQ